MALLKIHTFPDPILKQVAKPVTTFDSNLQLLSENMLETMYESKGVGLAATQVAVLKRLLVMDVYSGDEDATKLDPKVLINPEIQEKSEGTVLTEEGCLSVVEFTAEVRRAQKVKVRYQDIDGIFHTEELEDLAAICLQHEIDHLNGILFIDHLPVLRQKLVKKKLTKLAKKSA